MKRKLSEQDLESFEVKQCKSETVMNYSANYVPPLPDSPPCVPAMANAREHCTTNAGEADSELRRVMDNFINIYEQLGKCDGPNVKPNYSYTELAYLAMLRSPNFCLPITEIYRYIQSRFVFFKNSTRKHWKNAVRHSLAKTLCFTKIAVGRGKSSSENLSRSTYLWCIIPSSIASFARGDYRPSVDKDSGTNTLRWGYYRVNAGQFWDQVGNFLASKMVAFKDAIETSADPGQIFESQVCTLPQSLPQPQQAVPLTSLSVVNNSTAEVRSFIDATVPARTSSIPRGVSPPSYYQSQLYKCESPSAKIGSPDTPHLYRQKLPRTELLSPDPRFQGTTFSGRVPAYSGYECQDSGNESLGYDSSPEERRVLSSCRQQQFNGISPVLSLGSPNFSYGSDIEIAAFEVPELPDISYAISPNCNYIPQPQEQLFNDSGYAIDYSFGSDIDSRRYQPQSSCQYSYDIKPALYSSRVSSPNFETNHKPCILPDKLEPLQFENNFVTKPDPMFNSFSGNSGWSL